MKILVICFFSRELYIIGNALLWLKRRVLPLPWWFIFIGYAVALVVVGVCIYFIVVLGSTLGESLATQWLISMLVGTLESVVVEQPLKVQYWFNVTGILIQYVCRYLKFSRSVSRSSHNIQYFQYLTFFTTLIS